MMCSSDTTTAMRNFLITFSIVWVVGFFFANAMASAVDQKLDTIQQQRADQFCQLDSSFCK